MADHYLEPMVDGGREFLFNKPNPALTAILIGSRMQGIVADYTAKVAAVYIQRIAPRSQSQVLAGGVSATVDIGGRKNDRYVGEIVSSAVYAGADEFGRHAYNPYEGSHDLRDSLYSVLPQRI